MERATTLAAVRVRDIKLKKPSAAATQEQNLKILYSGYKNTGWFYLFT